MRSSLDYAGFAQLCGYAPIICKIVREHNRIIPRSLQTARLTADTDQNYAVLMLLIRRDLKTALFL